LTDGAVVVQLLTWAVLTAIALVISRKRPDLKILTIGLSVLVLGLMAVRAVH
jgi:hypothetical protein